jgi:parvulin-like peptidyl-prolyl isomerase
LRILAIIGALLMGVVLIFVGAGGAMWYAKRAAPMPAPVAGSAPAEAPRREPPRSGASEIEIETVRQLLALVQPERRNAVLDSSDAFAQFVQQERANQAVLTAAYKNAADRNDAVATLMLRASQKVLAEAYLTQVVRRNLDANFPSDEQAREFYDANKASFRLPDRVHLWQVFIPAAKEGSAQGKKNAAALAAQIAAALRKGKTDFAAAAAKYSKHVQSRVNDGYMGLLKTDDLLPEVRAAVEKLEPDEVSAPIQSDAGFHIIKRGARVAGTQLEYAEVRSRIASQLRREAASRVRQAAVRKIMETYPVKVDESAIDDWRRRLQSVDWSTTPSPAAARNAAADG